MKLRVIDYRPHTGGGRRFFVQLLKALQDSGELSQMEFVSHGDTTAQVRSLFSDYGIRAGFVDIPYRNRLRTHDPEPYHVPPEALESCDVAWLPWVHHHRIPLGTARPLVGSFHDALMFSEPKLALQYPTAADAERETTRQWLASTATIVCSSRFSMDVLKAIFGCPEDRLGLITLSARHVTDAAKPVLPADRWPWLSTPFLLCPSNISWHKNHEVLLEGYARARLPWPLVLTGPGSDLVNRMALARRILRGAAVAVGLRPRHRAGILRKLARNLGLMPGGSLVPIGNLTDAEYDAVLERAACVVMPTLGEGGGSFPVEEALLRGIPVICSDIPVLREHMARLGAEVIWFDPRQPPALAARLNELLANYDAIRAAARAQVDRLHSRRWTDVAADYLQVFRSAAG